MLRLRKNISTVEKPILKKAIEIDPNDQSFYMDRGINYYRKGNYEAE